VRYATFARAGGTNRIRIEGTANILHPTWQVESQIISGSAELGPGFPAAPKGVSAGDPVDAKISVSIPVRSLRSVGEEGRPFSDGMDALMCESLREPTNKQITYTLTSLTFQDQPPGTPDQFVYRATGNLCVAGVTNAVTMPVFVTLDGAGSIRFGGSVRVKMSDFKVVPPSINLGVTSLKTGDDVTLRFTWWVRRPGSAQASN
jgi:polyisoprenoid-binding protein YceI